MSAMLRAGATKPLAGGGAGAAAGIPTDSYGLCAAVFRLAVERCHALCDYGGEGEATVVEMGTVLSLVAKVQGEHRSSVKRALAKQGAAPKAIAESAAVSGREEAAPFALTCAEAQEWFLFLHQLSGRSRSAGAERALSLLATALDDAFYSSWDEGLAAWREVVVGVARVDASALAGGLEAAAPDGRKLYERYGALLQVDEIDQMAIAAAEPLEEKSGAQVSE